MVRRMMLVAVLVAVSYTHLDVYKRQVLVVSHDRFFLDRVANTIWEMSTAGVETYRGKDVYKRQV